MQQHRIVPQDCLPFFTYDWEAKGSSNHTSINTETNTSDRLFLFGSETHPDLPHGAKTLPHHCTELLQTFIAHLEVTTRG